MSRREYEVPNEFKRADGTRRFAFVTVMMLNDSFLPGALMLVHALQKQKTKADLVCLITKQITSSARYALGQLFDHVVEVERLFVPHKRRQERQDRPFLFTRLNALRLGPDGDLGFKYEKVVVLDADLLPLKHYDHLFTLGAPGGIINEHKSHVMQIDSDGRYVIPQSVWTSGTWKWHRLYDGICPHGSKIPPEITDRVKADPSNMGINGSLFVLEPSVDEFNMIVEDVRHPSVLSLVGDLFDWPGMQYLTMRWSGTWTNIDLRFSGFNGYPSLSVLFGTHYAGFKPWSFKKAKAMARWARHDDFRLWFQEYTEMVTRAYPRLRKVRRLERLLQGIQELGKR